jgi:hypothetical protein
MDGSSNFQSVYGVTAVAMNSGAAAVQNVNVNVTASVGFQPNAGSAMGPGPP